MTLFVCGSSGGYGGAGYDERGALDALGDARIARVNVRANHVIEAIQLVHQAPGRDVAEPRHGGDGGQPQSLALAGGEYIRSIAGRYGDRVDSLRIRTTEGLRLSVGGRGGPGRYRYEAPPGTEIAGLYGRSATQLDAIGVVLRTRPTAALGRVTVRWGPTGGHGGSSFDDLEGRSIPPGARLEQLVVRGGAYLDSVQVTHRLPNGERLRLPRNGGAGGNERRLTLEPGEYITRMHGHYGTVIDSLNVFTNRGRGLSIGGDPHWPYSCTSGFFQFELPPKCRLLGFFGRAGNVVDGLGVIVHWSSDNQDDAAPYPRTVADDGCPPPEPGRTSFRVTLAPQPPYEGLLPFVGTLGGTGQIASLGNPNFFPLLLPLPGGPAAGSVRLDPRRSTTPQQLEALYGSPRPTLPRTFTAYAVDGYGFDATLNTVSLDVILG